MKFSFTKSSSHRCQCQCTTGSYPAGSTPLYTIPSCQCQCYAYAAPQPSLVATSPVVLPLTALPVQAVPSVPVTMAVQQYVPKYTPPPPPPAPTTTTTTTTSTTVVQSSAYPTHTHTSYPARIEVSLSPDDDSAQYPPARGTGKNCMLLMSSSLPQKQQFQQQYQQAFGTGTPHNNNFTLNIISPGHPSTQLPDTATPHYPASPFQLY